MEIINEGKKVLENYVLESSIWFDDGYDTLEYNYINELSTEDIVSLINYARELELRVDILEEKDKIITKRENKEIIAKEYNNSIKEAYNLEDVNDIDNTEKDDGEVEINYKEDFYKEKYDEK